MLPVPTAADLADFSGRPESATNPYVGQALTQATLMFTVATKLKAMPEDPDLALLATYAIMEMADRLLLEQPYQAIKAGPFQTETIGSYSYSRITQTTKTVQQGLKTGLFWWDTAIDELLQVEQTLAAHGSIRCETDGLAPVGEDRNGVEQYRVVQEWEQLGGVPYVRIS